MVSTIMEVTIPSQSPEIIMEGVAVKEGKVDTKQFVGFMLRVQKVSQELVIQSVLINSNCFINARIIVIFIYSLVSNKKCYRTCTVLLIS